jgi:hypothetical protein
MKPQSSRWIWSAVVAALAVAVVPIGAAGPGISSVSGLWVHGGTITIAGTGFGTKLSAPPIVWDDASGTDVRVKWDGFWPSASQNVNFNLAYRPPIRGINPPHNRTGRYLAGAHGEGSGYNAGYNVMVWKNRTAIFPGYTYASWYQRSDDNWVFGGDNNYKCYDWSYGGEPYAMNGSQNNWYAEYNGRPTSSSSSAQWHINDDGSSLVAAGRWGGNATNPMSGVWAKIEVIVRWSTGSDGYVRIFDNGRQVMNYAGPTDTMSGTARNDAIGGYARMDNQPNNWRYFTDIYLDYGLARVILGNAATLAGSTIREMQIPSAWSDTSITVSANLGVLSAGQRVYLYVVDSSGAVNAQGYPVLVGSGAPLAPKNVIVKR